MNIFASEYTDRSLVNETSISIYKIVSALLSALPVGILTWLFWGMNKSIGKEYPTAMGFMALSVLILWGIIGYMVYNQFSQTNPEVPATWFQSLNALFIFTLAPVFSVIWQKLAKTKLNPNGPQKFAIGLILLGVGFIPMVIGASQIGNGMSVGEVSLSPVGLSYVNKLSPKRLLGISLEIFLVLDYSLFCSYLLHTMGELSLSPVGLVGFIPMVMLINYLQKDF